MQLPPPISWLIQPLRAVKARVPEWLRSWLTQRGFVLFRIPQPDGVPPSLVGYLQSLTGRGLPVDTAFSFDDEPQIQKELLGFFPPERVLFASRPAPRSNAAFFPSASSLPPPSKSFLVELDVENFDLAGLAAELPWIFAAEIILIRATLGFFWSGAGDLQPLVRYLAHQGFSFVDVLEYFKLHLLNAPTGRIVLVFENRKLKSPAGQPADAASRERTLQALTFLSNPIARATALTRLTGRGSLGFAAGVLNPGAIARGNHIVLLARGEHIPWAVSKKNLADFLRGCRPVLFQLDQNLAVTETGEAVFSEARETAAARLEDFRLFQFRDQLFSNHSRFAPLHQPPAGTATPVQFKTNASRITVGISRVDLAARQLFYLGQPTVDCPTGPAEKNWAMFEHQNELFLIYSFNPFHLLRATGWPKLDFKTVIRQPLKFPGGETELKYRNSINPVEYDSNHFLHLVHQVYPDKQYAFWAVLIEKNSLLPKRISARPLICGWKSAPAAIIYACAIIARPDEILVFGGLNDCAMGYWRIARSELDGNWTALE